MSRSRSVGSEIQQTRPFRSPAEEAAVGLLLTTDQLRRRFADVIEPAGITHQQYNVLRILRGSHPQPLATLEIAERMIERTPGITRLLDRLEAKGLALRERGRDDRRCVYCRISERGLALLATLDEPVHDVALRIFARLGDRPLGELVEQLDELRAHLRAERGDDGNPTPNRH